MSGVLILCMVQWYMEQCSFLMSQNLSLDKKIARKGTTSSLSCKGQIIAHSQLLMSEFWYSGLGVQYDSYSI